MHHNLYDLFGLNKTLFLIINYYTNVSIIPSFLQIISSIFFIANFAFCYLVFCLYFYTKIRKSENPAQTFISIYYELVRIGICYALFGLTYAALKFSVNLPRPFCSLPLEDFKTIIDITHERCLSSFPSAHTGLAILVAYCAWPYIRSKMKILACLVITLVAISRITLAMHYPADIIYSCLLTMLIILIGNFIYDKFKEVLIRPIGEVIAQILSNKK